MDLGVGDLYEPLKTEQRRTQGRKILSPLRSKETPRAKRWIEVKMIEQTRRVQNHRVITTLRSVKK